MGDSPASKKAQAGVVSYSHGAQCALLDGVTLLSHCLPFLTFSGFCSLLERESALIKIVEVLPTAVPPLPNVILRSIVAVYSQLLLRFLPMLADNKKQSSKFRLTSLSNKTTAGVGGFSEAKAKVMAEDVCAVLARFVAPFFQALSSSAEGGLAYDSLTCHHVLVQLWPAISSALPEKQKKIYFADISSMEDVVARGPTLSTSSSGGSVSMETKDVEVPKEPDIILAGVSPTSRALSSVGKLKKKGSAFLGLLFGKDSTGDKTSSIASPSSALSESGSKLGGTDLAVFYEADKSGGEATTPKRNSLASSVAVKDSYIDSRAGLLAGLTDHGRQSNALQMKRVSAMYPDTMEIAEENASNVASGSAATSERKGLNQTTDTSAASSTTTMQAEGKSSTGAVNDNMSGANVTGGDGGDLSIGDKAKRDAGGKHLSPYKSSGYSKLTGGDVPSSDLLDFDNYASALTRRANEHFSERWSLKGQVQASQSAHGATILSIATSKEKDLIATSSRDGQVRLWAVGLAKGQLHNILTYSLHKHSVFDIQFLSGADGTPTHVASLDHNVHIWCVYIELNLQYWGTLHSCRPNK